MKIALALGSGGSLGLAHIGVLKSLIDNKIAIDMIAGTSVGALIGAMYAHDLDIERVEKFWKGFDYKVFVKLVADTQSLGSGLVRGRRAVEMFEEYLGQINIEDLKIPFRATATDIIAGHDYIFESGSLTEAVRASCSIPFIIEPVEKEKMVLVDGAVSQPVPTEVARDMGADIVIGVNLDSYYKKFNLSLFKSKPSPLGVTTSSIRLMMNRLAKHNMKHADIQIQPELYVHNWLNFVKNPEEFIDKGYVATQEQIDLIKEKINA